MTASAASKDRGWAFSFRAQAAPGAGGAATTELELDIYDVVGPDDMMSMYFDDRVSAKSIKAKLDEFPNAKSLMVRINSVGGDVTDGMAIYSLLVSHAARVTCRVDGICASIASIIAMAADEIVMMPGAWMMIHEPYAPFMFDQRADDLESGAVALRKMSDSMATLYSERTGQKKDDVLAAMKATTWMTAEEAKALGYADKILPAKQGAETEEDPKESSAIVASLLQDFGRVPAGAFMAMARAHGDNMKAKARTPRASAVALAAAAAVAAAATPPAAAAEETETETETEEETVESLKAKIKDLEAKIAEYEEGDDEEEEDPEAAAQVTAIVAAAAAITGESNLANLEGALYALERRVSKPADAKAERKKLVSQLIANGKLAPARKDWATNCSAAALDAYIAGIGEQRIVQLNTERQPDEASALARTKTPGSAGAPEVLAEEEIVAKGLGLTPEQQAKARETRVARFGR